MIPCRLELSCGIASNRLGVWRGAARLAATVLRNSPTRKRDGVQFLCRRVIPRAQDERVRIPRFWDWAESKVRRFRAVWN